MEGYYMNGYKTVIIYDPTHAEIEKIVFPLRKIIMINADARPGANIIELSFDADDRYGDHPRMRGEKACKSSICAQSMGSPPHARGKAEQLLNSDLWKGITPECAGKSIFILYFLYIL